MMAPGGTMCEMKVGGEWGRKKKRKRQRRGREEPLHNKQASLPPPASCACILQLLVIQTPEELLTAVAWKVSAVSVAREANPLILQALWICHNLGAADANAAALLITSLSLSLSLSLSHWPDTHSHTHFISICLSLQIWIWTHDGAIGVHREMRRFYLQMQMVCSALKSVQP